MRIVLAVCLVFLTGCSRYADFTLPVLAGSPGKVTYEWTVHPSPVIPRGSDWDRVDALNPSVIRDSSGALLNFYSGYDGKSWHTGIASSQDGVSWQKKGKVFSPDASTWEGDYIAANGSSLYEPTGIMHWYQGARVPRIGLVFGSKKHGPPVLVPGPRGSWDERGVADPYVIKIGEYFFMYFLGQDRARRQRLGVARSYDGVTWQKYRGNPILELGAAGMFDDTGLGEPAVWSQHGWYWMLYTARDRQEYRRLGLARSRDGVIWTRVSEQPVLSGTQGWNSKVVCDPTVLLDGDLVRVWFGGGDKAEPAENLNGQIGYATLKLTLTP
jgi:predicted GH43/DUF377 family glycosyl hydrolase